MNKPTPLYPGLILIHSALGLMLGIWTALSFPALHSAIPLTIGIITAPLALLFKGKRISHILVIIMVYSIGTHLCLQKMLPPAKPHIGSFISRNQTATCTGVIQEALAANQERVRIILALETVFTASPLSAESVKRANNLYQTMTHGLIQLSMPAHHFDHTILRPGDRITVKAHLSPPRGFVNPGGFNLPFFLASQDIVINGWVPRPSQLIHQSLIPKWYHLTIWAEKTRATLISFYNKTLSPEHSALYRALITGDRSGLSLKTKEFFTKLGIYHLLAISGLHMGLLASFTMWLTTKLLSYSPRLLLHIPARQGAATLAMLPVILYCFISGLHPPAVRACLMTMVLFSGLILRKQWHGPTAIGMAAIIILSQNPLLLGMASFQLSFVAVTAIVMILPLLKSALFDTSKPPTRLATFKATLASGFLVSLVASIATLPLLLFHFNRVSLISPITTLIMEPLLCLWSLGCGLMASVIMVVSPHLAALLLKMGSLGFTISLWIGDKISLIPHINLWLPTPTIWSIVLFYICLTTLFIHRSKASALVFLLSCLILISPQLRKVDVDTVTIIDVGKGNSTLIESSSGETILIDCGGPDGSRFNIGRQVIAPLLWWKQIRHLDLIILSHADLDHYSGALFLIEHFRPKELWLPYLTADNEQWQKMVQVAQENQVTITIPQDNESYPLKNGGVITSLSTAHLDHKQWSQNEQSIVVRFTSQDTTFLLPGDIGRQSEEALVANIKDLKSTVLVAPHHGSKSSSTPLFLSHVQPEYVIFSASQYGRSLFPAPTIVKRYVGLKAIPLGTAQLGAITFRMYPEDMEIRGCLLK